jgi:transcriptional regulator with XRE-family HTH domain
MATISSEARIGPLLREWRTRRRRTQLDLALDAGISARHLSFVETGRSRPGREMLLRVAEELEIPFRERNQLLLAAGHAPAFPERSLDDPDLAPVREAIDLILKGHEPYPAVVVDRAYNLVAANAAAAVLVEGIDPELLEPPVNALRLGMHPRGMASRVINMAEVRAFFRERIERQLMSTADPELAAVIEEVSAYPVPEGEPQPEAAAHRDAREVLGPFKLRAADGGVLSFFGTFAIFDTPFEVTTSELAIELLFPADRETREALERPARERGSG